MNSTRIALSFTFVTFAALAGCAADPAGEPAADSAQAELKGVYGYEMHADRLADSFPEAAAAPREVQGRLAPEIARDVLRSSLPALRTCERAAGERRETPPAELRLRLFVAEDGSVARVTVSDAPGDLVACAKRAADALRFPKSTGGSFEVVYPVLLGSGS